MNKNTVRKAIVNVLIFLLIFTAYQKDFIAVQAAVKPSLIYANEPNSNIGIESARGKLWVKNRKKKAQYKFTSKDKKIVRVAEYKSKSGVPYAYCYGVKEGETVVTVRQIYNGKTTIIGSHKFYVKPAVLGYTSLKEPFVSLPVTDTYYKKNKINILDSYDIIKYKNTKASYICETKDSNILTLKKDGTIQSVLKEGTAKVTVTELYQGKKKVLGDLEITTETLSFKAPQNLTLYTGGYNYYNPSNDWNFSSIMYNLIDYTILDEMGKDGSEYLEFVSDNSLENDKFVIKKAGVVTVVLSSKETGTQLGEYKVTIKDPEPK